LWGGIGSTLFGGVPMMAVMGMYDYMTGSDRPHTNREWETWSRNYVHSIFGKTVADVYQYGLPAAAGINTSASLRFSNLGGVPEIRKYDVAGYTEFAAKVLTGAAGDVVEKMAETGTKLLQGDTRWETFATLLPRILEDPFRAYKLGTEGLKTAKGDRTIVPADRFTTFDLLAKGIGFNPSRVSDAQQSRAVIDLSEKTREDSHGHLLDKLVQSKGDKQALAEITRYNKSVAPADQITGQEIQRRFKEQARSNAQPDLYGMRVPRRQQATEFELTRFARP